VLPLITILMDGASQTTCVEVDELLADSHWRFNTSLASPTPQGETVDPALDNASAANIKALQDKANQLIKENSDRLAALAELLAPPTSHEFPVLKQAQRNAIRLFVFRLREADRPTPVRS
jgi:hypothetical protein